MTVPERELLLEHLCKQYRGVFTAAAIERHVDDYVELEPARAQLRDLLDHTGPVGTLLDVGCGFGPFVVAAREAGVDARGVEIARFEVDYARRRLATERPGDDPEHVYVEGDARRLPFPDASVDLVTLWNVLEHVPDQERMLAEAVRVLRPGGHLFAIAPNYAALRREAHYHLPWPPLLPKPLAARYLRALGRDPRFLLEDVHYVTNGRVRRDLRRLGTDIADDRRLAKLDHPEAIGRAPVRRAVELVTRTKLDRLVRRGVNAAAASPVRAVISVDARKPS